jgi:hypothetical protein
MAFFFVLFAAIGVLAPSLQRRNGRAGGVVLAIAVGMLCFSTLGYLVHQDPRHGLAVIEANRQSSLMILAFELPALGLALVSLRGFRKLFWVGWSIHVAFSASLAAAVIWLEFFWHW